MAASAVLGEALGLRRGEPLAEFAYAGFADAERAHLGELALVAVEVRAGADLELERHADLAGELEAVCRQHPLRERLWELLIVSLYRSGRQAEALRAYTAIRDRLVDELGIDPGPAYRARIPATPRELAGAGPAPGPFARAVPSTGTSKPPRRNPGAARWALAGQLVAGQPVPGLAPGPAQSQRPHPDRDRLLRRPRHRHMPSDSCCAQGLGVLGIGYAFAA
jgi:hypothetical protein